MFTSINPEKADVKNRIYLASHNWVYIGCAPHNGEYWYQCTICEEEDWIPSYGTEDQLRPAICSEAGPPK